MNSPKVVAVILNYNRPRDTIECLQSLKESLYENLQILVVDNYSSDNSVGEIQKRFQKLK